MIHISHYYNVLQNILSYIIIGSKMQHVSLPIYTHTHTHTKNQDKDFFTYDKIYYIYYNVITILWDGFGTITYKSQLLFSFFT